MLWILSLASSQYPDSDEIRTPNVVGIVILREPSLQLEDAYKVGTRVCALRYHTPHLYSKVPSKNHQDLFLPRLYRTTISAFSRGMGPD